MFLHYVDNYTTIDSSFGNELLRVIRGVRYGFNFSLSNVFSRRTKPCFNASYQYWQTNLDKETFVQVNVLLIHKRFQKS